MSTNRKTQNEIQTLRNRVAAQQAAAQEASATAAQSAAEAARLDQALQAHRERGSMEYARLVMAGYAENRDAALQAVADARDAFKEAVLAGKPYVHLYLAIKQAEHDAAALEYSRDSSARKIHGRGPDVNHPLPESTLADELNAVVSEEIDDLQETRRTAMNRAIGWIDQWCDDNPVDLDTPGNQERVA